jgi:hypothetical protein
MRGLEGLVIGSMAIVLLGLVVIGCLMFHVRLRTKASASLLWLLGAAIAWGPLVSLGFAHFAEGGVASEIDAIHYRVEMVGGLSLLLAAATSFLVAVLSIGPRPNQSFKPTSLRDAA